MATTANFDLFQTAFLFNWAANSSCLIKGNAQDLADFVYHDLYGTKSPISGYTLPGIFPQLGASFFGGNHWDLVWGPGVHIIDPLISQKADNTAFVVYNSTIDTYVVAIAGTDPGAPLDWFVEDFEVGPNDCVAWDKTVATAKPAKTGAALDQPQLSYGTAFGIWALGSQLTLSRHAPSGPSTLAGFLSGLTVTPTTRIIFTGHSLGGALSPTLAHWAKSFTGLSTAQVLALPTAGATPGNKAYQTAWDAAFPPTLPGSPVNLGDQVGYFNCDVWNQQDVVPHAWANIYTSSVQSAGTPPAQQFYFSEPSATQQPNLQTQLGPIEPGTLFRSLAAGRQAAGAGAYMTRSAHTTPFPTIWPLQYIDSTGSAAALPQPFGPYTGDASTFLGALAKIHVWGYGLCGFGLDLSVFLAIHPIKS